MDSAIVVRNERTRPLEKQEIDNITQHSAAISRALAHAAAELGTQKWCEGTSLTLADLALASALVYLDLRLPELAWRTLHNDLAQWFTRMSNRESMRTSLTE
jgi:glutathione S-transferase